MSSPTPACPETAGRLPGRSAAAYSQDVGTTSANGAHPQVRVAAPVVTQMRKMPRAQAAAAARAIEGIGPDIGTPLRIPTPGNPGGRYLALVPDDPQAPVVLYRPLSHGEGCGYFVAALASRETYDAFRRAEREGLLETALGKALLAAATAADGAAGPDDP